MSELRGRQQQGSRGLIAPARATHERTNNRSRTRPRRHHDTPAALARFIGPFGRALVCRAGDRSMWSSAGGRPFAIRSVPTASISQTPREPHTHTQAHTLATDDDDAVEPRRGSDCSKRPSSGRRGLLPVRPIDSQTWMGDRSVHRFGRGSAAASIHPDERPTRHRPKMTRTDATYSHHLMPQPRPA